VIGKIFGDGEGGDGVDLFLLHEAHGFVAELIGVIDGDDAGLDSVKSAGFTGGVNSDVFAKASGFLNGGGEFGFGELIGSEKTAVAKGVRASFVDLDEVGALLELLTNDGDELIGGVGVGGVGQDVLLWIEAVGIFVAAENVDGIAGDAEAWAGDQAGVDGVANSGIGGAGAFGTHVAFGGEPGEEVFAGGLCGKDSALGDGLFDGLEVFGTRMEEEVDVGVDEAGEERGVAEIDDLGGGGMRNRGANFNDAFALDENFAGSDDFAGFDVEEAGGVENDGLWGVGLRKRRRRKEQQKKRQKADARVMGVHGGNHNARAFAATKRSRG